MVSQQWKLIYTSGEGDRHAFNNVLRLYGQTQSDGSHKLKLVITGKYENKEYINDTIDIGKWKWEKEMPWFKKNNGFCDYHGNKIVFSPHEYPIGKNDYVSYATVPKGTVLGKNYNLTEQQLQLTAIGITPLYYNTKGELKSYTLTWLSAMKFTDIFDLDNYLKPDVSNLVIKVDTDEKLCKKCWTKVNENLKEVENIYTKVDGCCKKANYNISV